ncbi:MAG: hypothetical protein ACR2MQ_04975 [Gemmatimonadaceae bacterium]
MVAIVTRYDTESDHTFGEREGEELDLIVQEEAGLDVEPAEDLARVLEDIDDFWPGDGEERFYDRQEAYEQHSFVACCRLGGHTAKLHVLVSERVARS